MMVELLERQEVFGAVMLVALVVGMVLAWDEDGEGSEL